MSNGFRTLIIVLIVILIVVLFISMTANTPDLPCEAELLMPGNTLVVGTCTEFHRISSGWVYIKIDNKEYCCNEWRIVLKGE